MQAVRTDAPQEIAAAACAGPVAERARDAIGRLLPSGRAKLTTVAASLGTSPRSLQRHLEAEACPFGALLDAVRRDLAARDLAEPARPISSIAKALGYASPSSFTRWFTGAFGISPLAWRREHTAASER